jgi:hypothetical protein
MKVVMSRTWKIIIVAGLFTAFIGYKFNLDLFFFIGLYACVGALTCGTTGVIIKKLRKR